MGIRIAPMAYTCEYSFNQFYEGINLSGDHRGTANARKEEIVARLEDTFTIVEAFATGSIPKFTALRAKADLDVMIALHHGKHIGSNTPTQVLEAVRKACAPWRPGSRKNGQAVTLAYSTWPSVDVVPVFRTLNSDNTVDYYNVPDSNTNTWIQSRPKEHAAAIEAKSTTCGYNFRRIIKMIKHWNKGHSDYLQSYHIEVLALNVFDTNLDDTAWHVFQFFDKAKPLLASHLYYQTGFVDIYLNYADRQEVLKRIDSAIEISRDAWYRALPKNNDNEGAITKWRQLFGDAFPAYG
jgi:hypothetical protein